jgi:hypothetical protein
LGYDVKVDFLKVLDIGYSYINPIIASKGIHPLDVVSGYADFHSSYMHLIHKYSAKYSIDPAILIIEMSKIDKINVDEKILEGIARKIKKNTSLFIGKYNFSRYVGSEQDER